MELRHYLDAARRQRGLSSDYELAKLLRVTRQTVSQMRKQIFIPGDELMVRIADAADSERDLALLHLNYWRARHGEAKKVYKELYERLSGSALALVIGAGVVFAPTPPARAFSDNPPSVYYGKISQDYASRACGSSARVSNVDDHAVVPGLDARWTAPSRGLVIQARSHMCEDRALGPETLDPRQGLMPTGVGGMRVVPDTIDDP